MAMAAGPEVERAEELGALHRVALLVARAAPLETVFHAAGEQSAVLLGAAAGAVLRFLGEERAVVLSSLREPGTRGLPVNAEVDFEGPQSALVKVRATRRPARLDSFEFGRGELPRYMRASGVRGALAAPVLVDGEVWGALAVSTIREDPFPAGTEERLAPFAELVAQAVVNSEARRRLVQAADESRQRLERELHEGAQQHLLALTLKLRLAHERADEGSLFAKLLAEALADANEATAALDDLGRSLHPAVLAERGLAPALQALAARAAVPVHLREVPARRFHARPRRRSTASWRTACARPTARSRSAWPTGATGCTSSCAAAGARASTTRPTASRRSAATSRSARVGAAEAVVRGTVPVELQSASARRRPAKLAPPAIRLTALLRTGASDERLDHARVELRAARAVELLYRRLGSSRGGRPVARHRVVCVADRDDARAERDRRCRPCRPGSRCRRSARGSSARAWRPARAPAPRSGCARRSACGGA